MKYRKVLTPHRLSDEYIIKVARSCSSRGEFFQKFPRAYQAAHYRGLHVVLFPNIRQKPFKITETEIFESAKRYKHVTPWRDVFPGHYQAARQREIFDKVTSHMEPMLNPWATGYQIYAHEFSDNHVYVGLTFRPDERRFAHTYKGPVYEHGVKLGLFPEFKELENQVIPTRAPSREDFWMETYRLSGWTMINKAKAGSLGSLGHRIL